jgi:hypothetical protein
MDIGVVADGAHAPCHRREAALNRFRPCTVKRVYCKARLNAWTACPEDFRWPRLPGRVEGRRDVFNPSLLNDL